MGGYEAAKKANADAQHKDSNIQHFIGNYIKNKLDSAEATSKSTLKSIRESLAAKQKEASETPDNSKFEYAKQKLEAAGFDKETIKTASEKYSDPVLMATHARALEKEKLADVKKKLETAKDESQKARDQVNSKEHIREYLDGMKVSGDPELERLFSKVFKHRGDKPITDAQRITLLNKIDEYLDNQKTAYEGLVKKGGTDTPENKAKAATYASMQKTLQENIKKVDAERAEAKAELARTVKEREDLENMYDKMFVEGEKRAKKVEAVKELDNQIQDLTEALKSMGAPDNYIQKYVHNAFIKHDTALSPKELNKIRAKAVNDLSNLEAKKTKELKSEVAPEIKKLDDSQLERAVTNHMLDIDETKSSTNPEYAAVSEALEDELVARGMKESAEEISAFQDMMTVAEERKRLLPGDENKDYWISAEDYANLQDKINKGSGSSYMGNLGVKLRLHLFDDRNAEKHIRFTNKVINNKLEGKGIDDDIIVR